MVATARKPIVGGNWKCNPASASKLPELMKNFEGCGAYTGEMAVEQIKDMGMGTVLIGHSERRGEFGLPTPKVTNALLATKLAYILEAGLTCVFCIGEALPIREKGIEAVIAECGVQLTDIIPILKALEDKSRVV